MTFLVHKDNIFLVEMMMQNFRSVILSAMVSAMAMITPAYAATVNVNLDTGFGYGSAFGIGSYTGTSTLDLVGMQLNATYTDGSTEAWNWVQYNQWRAGTDHISNDLTIGYSHHGFAMNATKRLSSFEVNLVPANMIFDAGEYLNSDPRNSPTTSSGQNFAMISGNDALMGEITATYSERVRINHYLLGEDAYTNLFIDFSGLENGGLLGEILWDNDTDSLMVAGDLTPIPLPAGLLLLLTACGAFGLVKLRTKSRPEFAGNLAIA